MATGKKEDIIKDIIKYNPYKEHDKEFEPLIKHMSGMVGEWVMQGDFTTIERKNWGMTV